MKTNSLIKSTAYLTIAGVITKFLGFAYRIYMSNELGAEMMGLYQLVMPIYFLAWSITSSGITTTISKLTSENIGKREYGKINQFFWQCILITFFISITLSLVVINFAPFISNSILHESRVTNIIKILSLSFPFMALGSCIRGYFYGLQKSAIPAISQVVEQFFKILVIVLLTLNFGKLNLVYAIIGIVLSEFISFVYVCYEYKKGKLRTMSKINITSVSSLFIILSMSVPLTFNRILMSLLITFENILIPIKLQEFGLEKSEAISLFGQVTGMALPLIYFPSSLLMAISTTLVPAISKAKARNNMNSINNNIHNTMIFTAFSGFWALTFFVLFSKHLSFLIYNQDISLYILCFGILSPFLYLQMVMGGILNGLGNHITLFINNIFSSSIAIFSIYYFIPKVGILGFIFGILLSYMFVCIMNYNKIKLNCTLKLNLFSLTLKPFLSSLCAILILNYIFNNFNIFMNINYFSFFTGSILMSIIYLFFVIQTGYITFDEIKKVLNYLKTPIIKLNKNLFS